MRRRVKVYERSAQEQKKKQTPTQIVYCMYRYSTRALPLLLEHKAFGRRGSGCSVGCERSTGFIPRTPLSQGHFPPACVGEKLKAKRGARGNLHGRNQPEDVSSASTSGLCCVAAAAGPFLALQQDARLQNVRALSARRPSQVGGSRKSFFLLTQVL